MNSAAMQMCPVSGFPCLSLAELTQQNRYNVPRDTEVQHAYGKKVQSSLNGRNANMTSWPTATGQQSGNRTGFRVPAERVAKSVILDDHHGHYLMAVLPPAGTWI
jgi:hypothetical protein